MTGSTRGLGRAVAAPLVLALVASVQIYRTQAERLTPWKGGGFGMFAQNESANSRLLRCTLTLAGEGAKTLRTLVPIPRRTGLSEQVNAVLAAPSAARVARLVQALSVQDWRLFATEAGEWHPKGAPKGDALLIRAEPEQGLRDTGRRLRVVKVELEVYRARFESDGPRLVPQLIERQVVERAPEQLSRVAFAQEQR